MPDGKAEGGSLGPEDPKPVAPARASSHALVEDLFDGAADQPSGSTAPLDAEQFLDAAERAVQALGPAPNAEAPTERIDLEAPGAAALPPLPTGSAPEPLDLGFGGPPQTLQLDAGPDDEDDLLGLPVGSRPVTPAPAAAPPAPPPAVPSPAPVLPSLQSAPASPVTPRLPCTLVIVAADRAAGAGLAAGLMAAGYTCRAATAQEAPSILAERGVDAAVVDGAAQDISVGAWRGPTVFVGPLSTATMHPGWRQVATGAAPDAIVGALETARQEALLAAAANEAERHDIDSGEFPSARPIARVMRAESLSGSGHIEMSGHVVRALWIGADGKSSRGRVRSVAPSGQLLVDFTEPPPLQTQITATLIMVDGQRADILGHIERSGEGQALIELAPEPEQASLLHRFMADARDPNKPAVEPVRIRDRAAAARSSSAASGPEAPAPEVDEETLRRLFDGAANNLDDDEAQQAFIQACIKSGRLQFAVQCYRELKNDRPDDERPAKYLEQVGTILGFYAFQKQQAAAQDDGMPKVLKYTLFAFVFGVLALWVIVEVLAT